MSASLLADVGGTNVRFAVTGADGAAPGESVSWPCARFAGLAEAVRAYLAVMGQSGQTLRRAAFAVAAPIDAEPIRLTNSGWTLDRRELQREFGFEQLFVANDYAALARALPTLSAADLKLLGDVAPPLPRLAMAVLGPGTGLGVAGLVPAASGWSVVAGEGGHATLAAADDYEAAVIAAARRQFPHVSAERLLSGTGLPFLWRAVAAVDGVTPAEALAPEVITRLGVASSDAQCRRTVDLFFALLGSFAGNVALTFGARGGVFISGGIVPQLADFAERSAFRQRFQAKGRFEDYLRAIPTAVIVAQGVALRGLAHLLAETPS